MKYERDDVASSARHVHDLRMVVTARINAGLSFLAGKLRWTDLATVGLSPISRIISVTPIISTFLYFLNNEFLAEHAGALRETLLAFVGLFIFGSGSILFNLTCPRLVKYYPNPASFMQLHNYFTSEGLEGMKTALSALKGHLDSVDGKSLSLKDIGVWAVKDDEGYVETGFRSACTMKTEVLGETHETEDRIRVLWYFHLVTNHCRASVRIVISILFATGGVLVLLPSLATLVDVVVLLLTSA